MNLKKKIRYIRRIKVGKHNIMYFHTKIFSKEH